MEVRVHGRPQSVGDFLQALRGFRPRSPIPQNHDRAVPAGVKVGRRTAKEKGCVIINVDRAGINEVRIGRLPIDREVTIHVARVLGATQTHGRPPACKLLGPQERTRGIELAPGYYRFWATCVTTGCGLLESSGCDLTVPPGNQPVHLTVRRLDDGLHLTTGKPSEKKTPVAKGKVMIARSRSFPSQWLVRIKIDKMKAEAIDDIILGGTASYRVEDNEDHIQVTCANVFAEKTFIILHVAAGSYRLSASCTDHLWPSSATGEMTTNKCLVNILANQSVTLKLDRQQDDIYLLGPGEF